MKKVISLGADYNKKDINGKNLLFYSIEPKITEFLISLGLNINERDIDGRTPLFYSQNKKNRQILIKAGADIKIRDINGQNYEEYLAANEKDDNFRFTTGNPFSIRLPVRFISSAFINAVESGDYRKTEQMLKIKPEFANSSIIYQDPYTRTDEIITPLQIAAENRHTKIISLLLKYKAKPLNYNKYGKAYSLISDVIGSKDTVKELIEHGADINSAGTDSPPVHSAINNGNIAMIDYLVAKGADINVKNSKNQHLISVPLSFFSSDIIEHIIRLGWNINNTDPLGNTLLIGEVCNNHFGSVRFLISHGADINKTNKLGESALFFAQSPAVAEMLIKAGADINLTDFEGNTPVFAAANPEMINFYKSIGIPLQVTNKNGKNRLTKACFSWNPELIYYYINLGDDINLKDNEGKTPLHYVALHFSSSLLILLNNKANPNIKDNEGKTALHYATLNGKPKNGIDCTIKTFLNYGADPNIKDNKGNTPLHYAAARTDDFFNPVILIKAGADPNIRNNKGETPADVAIKSGNPQAKSFILRLKN